MPSHITQYVLWLLHQPASEWPPSLSSTDLYAAAYQQEFHTSDTQGLIASELQDQFSRNTCKKTLSFLQISQEGNHCRKASPPPSLLSSHPKKHMLPLGLVTTEISVEITIEFWKALGQSLPCTSTQKNRGETQSSVSSTTNSYVSLCEQQEEKAGAFFLYKCKNWYRLEIKEKPRFPHRHHFFLLSCKNILGQCSCNEMSAFFKCKSASLL